MKVVCVDSCIRSSVFGIDVALRNRFELFEEMKVPYELWVSKADTDIYANASSRQLVLDSYEALGLIGVSSFSGHRISRQESAGVC